MVINNGPSGQLVAPSESYAGGTTNGGSTRSSGRDLAAGKMDSESPTLLPWASQMKATFLNAHVPINTARKLKVIQIGAGVTGIQMCYKIQELKDVDFIIYEKNTGLGGTWFENRYPGCACDIPAHIYCYTWEPNPNWSRLICGFDEILKYLEAVVDKYGFRKYMNFEHKIVGAHWSEEDSKWYVKIEKSTPRGPVVFTDSCDVLISGTGVLNVWKYPEIDGLHDYKGKLLHTAQWDDSWDPAGKTVAVMGSGASAIQVIPQLQKTVRKIDVYIRSPTWMMPDPWAELDPPGMQKIYTPEEISRFNSDPEHFLAYRKKLESHMNCIWPLYYKNSLTQMKAQEMFQKRYEDIFKDPSLRAFMKPNFEVGCRRPTSGDPFVTAIQEPNAEVFQYGVTKMNEQGIVGKDGITRAYDAIVCATGFDTSFKPRFPLGGRGGHELRMDFEKEPEAYLGHSIHGYPNFFMFSGPIAPVGNGSAYPGAELMSEYVIKFLRKMQHEGVRTFEISKRAQDDFNEWVQSKMPNIVWTGGCNSWYKNPKTGKVQVTWPGSMLHYRDTMHDVHYEHYHFDYRTKNCFDWLGNGLTWEEMYNKEADMAPYIT